MLVGGGRGAVKRDADFADAAGDDPVDPLVAEPQAEIGADGADDAARPRHGDQGVDARIEQRLTPVEEIHHEDVVADLVHQLAEQFLVSMAGAALRHAIAGGAE